MDDKQLRGLLETGDAEFVALRLALKALTAIVSTNFPNGEVARAFESTAEAAQEEPGMPPRAIEYLSELAEVARKAVTPDS